MMEGTQNTKYKEVQFEIKRKEKLKEVFYDHDDDTVYVDSHRNISVALGEVTDLSKELKDKGFEEKVVVGGPSLEMFLTEARFQLRQQKLEVSMASLISAEKLCKDQLPVSVLATKASVLACLGQFEKSLSMAELILTEERQHCLALSVKADSLFNLCMFESALVMYHRGRRLTVRGGSRLEKGIDNCEETISSLLRPKDSLAGLAALLAERRLGGLGSLGWEKSLIQRTVGRFKSYKEDKLKQEKPPGKISQDRLKPDKKLLLELTKLETVIVIKRRQNWRPISAHAREMLDYLRKREHFWQQLNK